MKTNVKEQVNKRLTGVNSLLSNSQVRRNKNIFLEKYMQCELACKLLLVDYHQKKASPKTVEYKEGKIRFSSVRAACQDAGVTVPEDVIKRVFSSADKRGSKSAKKLRDSIVHEMSVQDIKEVNQRFTDLCEDMDAFLDVFKSA